MINYNIIALFYQKVKEIFKLTYFYCLYNHNKRGKYYKKYKIENCKFCYIAHRFSGIKRHIFSQRDKGGKARDKCAYSADIHAKEQLPVILGKP